MKKACKKKNYNILIVDDEKEYQNVFSLILKSRGYDVMTCSGGEEALGILNENSIDLVMTDLRMPGMDGNELILKIKEKHPDVSIMVMTAYGTIENAVESMRNGAQGYFMKGSNPEIMAVEIDKLYEMKRLQISNSIFKKEALSDEPYLKTKNAEFGEILRVCEKAAESDINVLLMGESGVGKEVLANYIHNKSDRRDKHFVPVNCQAFSAGVVESELFGHEKGAFTGANEKRIGRFEEANEGTIFLDEIGDLPIDTQSKLLRALESRKIERVGSNKEINLDIRIISATNKSLEEGIAKGTFRQDLLYRINSLEITIPPLRRRREDLPELIEYFINKISKEQKKNISGVEEQTMKLLLEYDYPGNVRELKNIIERMIVMCDDGLVKKSDILGSGKIFGREDVTAQDYSMTLKDARNHFEKDYLENVISRNNGNVSSAARSLDISVRQLWNRIKELDVKY